MTTTIQIPSGPHTSSSPRSFFDWHESPSDRPYPSTLPALSPSSRSSSLESDSDSPRSPVSPTSPWVIAAAEAQVGVHYVRERFPASGTVCGAPPFVHEPLLVRADDRVALLEEEGEHALRVRVIATGEVGLIPIWNVEGALERLARLNMEFNEAATCPVESRYLRGKRGAEASIAHMHSRCIPFAMRYPLSLHTHEYEVDESFDEFDADDEDVPVSARRQKSVEFAKCEHPVVFRYPSESLVFGEDEGTDIEDECEPEWWSGWEEDKEKFEVRVEVQECEVDSEFYPGS